MKTSILAIAVVLMSGVAGASSSSHDLINCIKTKVSKDPINTFGLQKILASTFTENGSLTTNQEVINSANQACRSEDNQSVEYKLHPKSMRKAGYIIDQFIKPKFICTETSTEIKGALAFFGGSVGAGYAKCEGSDGSVRLYAGPKTGYGIGAAVMVKKTKENWKDQDEFCLSPYGGIFVGAVSELVKGYEEVDQIFASKSDKETALGLGAYGGVEAMATVRVGNLSYNWKLIDEYLVSENSKFFDYKKTNADGKVLDAGISFGKYGY